MGHEDDIAGWWQGRLPDAWHEGTARVSVDREEVVVELEVAPPEVEAPTGGGDDARTARAAEAARGRLARFREETRDERIAIAREAEHRFGRKVAWAATCGDERQVFSHLAVPVMTRLRQPERIVLDTLVESGVARSRADALAWCVRLVGQHSDDWLRDLRGAMTEVQRLRDQGPATT